MKASCVFRCIGSGLRRGVSKHCRLRSRDLPRDRLHARLTAQTDTAHAPTKIMRPMDKIKSRMACIRSAKRKLLRLGAMLSRNEERGHTKVHSPTTPSSAANDFLNDEMMGKMAMMSRFIRDVETKVSETSQKHSHERTSLTNILSKTFVIKPELDRAFLSDTSDYDSSEDGVLNDCMMQDYVFEYESESAFGDDSECSSVCELERNVSDDVDVNDMTLRNLRAMFGDRNSAVSIGDTALESFMNTVVEIGNQSDEGHSSAGSDCL